MLLIENTKLFTRQIRILISRFFYVTISPTLCGQYMSCRSLTFLSLLGLNNILFVTRHYITVQKYHGKGSDSKQVLIL